MKTRVKITDNDLGNCLLKKVYEAVGYDGYSFTTDDDDNTYVGDIFVSSNPKIAVFVRAAEYLMQGQPEHIKCIERKGVAGRVATAIRKSNTNKKNKDRGMEI